MKNKEFYRNIAFLSDMSGTGYWRHIQQMMAVNGRQQDLNIDNTFTQAFIPLESYYKNINSVTVQRWLTDHQTTAFLKFLKPICDNNCAWLIYAIDDAMSSKDIPAYNKGWKAFSDAKIQQNITLMLNNADFVVVTTEFIKNYYHDRYNVPLENIIAIPNFLPRYWFGDRYQPAKKLDQFRKFKQKPRIGVISSLSHYNIEDTRVDTNGNIIAAEEQDDKTIKWFNQNHEEVDITKIETKIVPDDFDEICDVIRNTVDEYQWVIFGHCPPKIKDLIVQRKIEVYGGVPILNYASKLDHLCLQAIVAPLIKSDFNSCKSHIKYMEASAIGVPLFATNCLPYSRVMDKRQLFDTGEQLTEMLHKLKWASSKIYEDIIQRQWTWLNTPCHEGDFDIKNYWLEDNLNIWIDLFKLRKKGLHISLSKFVTAYKKMKQDKEIEKATALFANDNVMIVK